MILNRHIYNNSSEAGVWDLFPIIADSLVLLAEDFIKLFKNKTAEQLILLSFLMDLSVY